MLIVDSALIEAIMARYGVGEQYIQTYLSRIALPEGTRLRTIDQIMRLPGMIPAWFDYAMSANQRGEAWAVWLSAQFPGYRGRFLDIGCGTAGLVTAMARRGWRAFGFDHDDDLIPLAHANCRDMRRVCAIERGELLDSDFMARVARAALVTMIGVLNGHEDDDRALVNAISAVEDGGALVFDVPNPQRLGAPSNAAKALPIEAYTARCHALGLQVQTANSPTSYVPLPSALPGAFAAHIGTDKRGRRAADLLHESAQLERIMDDFLTLTSEEFGERYLRTGWTIIAHR